MTYLRPDSQGTVDWRAVDDAITPETLLVSIMAANNEVGTIQPIERIGEVCERHGVYISLRCRAIPRSDADRR